VGNDDAAMTTVFPAPLPDLVEETPESCRSANMTLVLRESSTGGMVAACLKSISRTSAVVERGIVACTNRTKQAMLDVLSYLSTNVGVVSADVARAGAEGVLAHSPTWVSVLVTDIAGPGGATPGKPVRLAHLVSVPRRCSRLRGCLVSLAPGSRYSAPPVQPERPSEVGRVQSIWRIPTTLQR
jgi:nicotinamide-nucleotide amidase